MTLAELPKPNQTIANGIHANGGIGLKVKKIGFTKASIFLLAPIKMPRRIPKEEETKNPVVTNIMLCRTCWYNLPLPYPCIAIILKEFQVSVGEGNLALDIAPLHSVKPNQATSNMAKNNTREKSLLKISNSL
jgi:hypothetical protein